MDEVLFHLSQRIEIFQVWIVDAISKIAEAMEASLVSERFILLQEAVREAAFKFVTASNEALHRSLVMMKPNLLSSRISSFLSHDMNRATVYAGCVGFTLGSGIGLVIGGCLQSPSRPAAMMRALAATSFTGADSVVLLEDALVPSLTGCDQVLIQVKASSLDLVDLKICHGYARTLRYHFNRYNPNWRGELPVVLGRGGSGIVAEVGSGVCNLDIGDQVFFTSPPWSQGTAGEWVLLPSDCVARKPNRIGFEGSASLPYAGVMAWNAVVRMASLTPRNAHMKRVLVHSGSYGCGWMILQLCSHLGAAVTVTCPNRASSVMKCLGAAEVIPLELGDAERILLRKEKFDIVFNTVGSLAQSFCLSVCSVEGCVVTAAPGVLPSDTFGVFLGTLYSLWRRITRFLPDLETRSEMRNRSEALEEVRKLAENGRIRPLVDRVFPAEEAGRALSHVENPTAVGKTVLRMGL